MLQNIDMNVVNYKCPNIKCLQEIKMALVCKVHNQP